MKNIKLETSKQALLNSMTAMAVFTLAAVFPELAFAQTSTTGLGAVTKDVSSGVGAVLPMISIGSYLGGTIFGVSTLLDAKKYSENPSGFSGGIGKIATKGGVAAGLFTLPSVMDIVQDSFFTTSGTATYKKLDQNF